MGRKINGRRKMRLKNKFKDLDRLLIGQNNFSVGDIVQIQPGFGGVLCGALCMIIENKNNPENIAACLHTMGPDASGHSIAIIMALELTEGSFKRVGKTDLLPDMTPESVREAFQSGRVPIVRAGGLFSKVTSQNKSMLDKVTSTPANNPDDTPSEDS